MIITSFLPLLSRIWSGICSLPGGSLQVTSFSSVVLFVFLHAPALGPWLSVCHHRWVGLEIILSFSNEFYPFLTVLLKTHTTSSAETLTTTIQDIYPEVMKKLRIPVTLGVCIVLFFLGLVCVTQVRLFFGGVGVGGAWVWVQLCCKQ